MAGPHLDQVHAGFPRSLRRLHCLRLSARRIAGRRPLPGPGELEFRQEHRDVRSVGFLDPPQRHGGRRAVPAGPFGLCLQGAHDELPR
ncbi:hypothetical protein PICSAR162_02909 [Mycobacterium avium subsp. paratuberculosis]|nr:hypothetical protein PICSAR162_02909 [Mycobacterium avium subsp. paratuberculosis]